MLLPETLTTVAFYIFCVTRVDQKLKVKNVNYDGKWYGFVQSPLVAELPALQNEINGTLIFGDVLVKVDQTKFEDGWKMSLTKYYFGDHGLYRILDQNSFNKKQIPELKQNSVFVDALNIIKFSHNYQTFPLQTFDIVHDKPKSWIIKVKFAIELVDAKLDKHGKIVLGYLLKRADWDWLNDKLIENPYVSWKTLQNDFVEHFTNKQKKEYNSNEMPMNDYEDVEVQILRKMRILHKTTDSNSIRDIRLAILNGFAGESQTDQLDPLYEYCDKLTFVRACRMDYERKVWNSQLNGRVAIENLEKFKRLRSDLLLFSPTADEPSQWIYRFERLFLKTNRFSEQALMENGTSTLAMYLRSKEMNWLSELLKETPDLDWKSLKTKFVEYFETKQETLKESIFTEYVNESDVLDFIQDKVDIWLKLAPEINSIELKERIVDKLPLLKQPLVEGCTRWHLNEFSTCCKLAFSSGFLANI